MNQIFNSVTKLVLLAMILGLLVFTYQGITDSKDFISLCFIVVSYYFGKKDGQASIDSTNVK